MPRESRRELLQKIERKRESRVIAYVTSDRPNASSGIAGDIVPVIHEHILALDVEDRQKLDLFIYSRGGDSDVPWSLVSMFREHCEEGSFSVLIPYRAHSAATMIALGADAIIMTKKAELGPIDITIQRGPYNPTQGGNPQPLPISVEDVMGYFALLDKVGCTRPDEKMRGFEQLTSQVHPLALGMVSRLLEQTELVALRLLGTRADAFTEEQNREVVKRLSSEIFSHRHAISRTEAMSHLQLSQVVKAEDENIADELWQLYCDYRELFSLDDPFRPEEFLIANDLEANTWERVPMACVESNARYDICRKDIQVRRTHPIPPQVTLNLNGMAFPSVDLPSLPEGVTPEQIAQLIQQIMPQLVRPVIDAAVDVAARKFLQALPSGQFERIEYNTGWEVI